VTSRNRAAAFLLLLFAAIVAMALVRGLGPAPEPATAPASHFSAARAVAALHDIIGNTPHPVGSAEHDAVRDRVAGRFRSLGYDVQVQHAFACNPWVCAPVDNIIARLPFAPTGDALALAAHYDSVPAGPGASDDGIGVAMLLEVARVVRTMPMRNALVFVITDAEELGLLGATAFVNDPSVSHNVAAVINTENRGTSGTSYLFETSVKNEWLLPIIASALPRPASSSLFFDIYQLLPNDTDLTVFKAAGKQGLGFAAIDGVTNYHTPLDDLAHVTPSTVQDHGDHVLAMARALGDTELRQVSSQNATWFDVLNFAILWWPSGWTAPIAFLALVLIIIAALLRMREGAVRARQITWGVVAFFVSMFAAFLIALFLALVAGLRAAEPWVAYPLPAIAMAWLTGIGAAIAAASFFRRHAEEDGLMLGAALSWCVLAVVTAALLPGGSYLFLIPAAALTICAVLRAFLVDVAELTAGAIVTLIAGVLYAPLALKFYVALGFPILPAVAAVVALIATAFAPVIAAAPLRRMTIIVCFAGAIVFAVIALALPPATRDVPRRLNINYIADATGRTLWTATGPLGSTFRRQPATWAPWNVRSGWATPAPRAAVPAPSLRVVSDVRGGKRVLTLQLHSNRHAPRITLAFHTTATVDSIRVNGTAVPPPQDRRRVPLAPDWHRVAVAAPDAQVEIVLRAVRAIDVLVLDATPGLPPTAAPLTTARTAAHAVMTDNGDETIVIARTRL
jgi:hypothetical protein